jgi:hypothetical protein
MKSNQTNKYMRNYTIYFYPFLFREKDCAAGNNAAYSLAVFLQAQCILEFSGVTEQRGPGPGKNGSRNWVAMWCIIEVTGDVRAVTKSRQELSGVRADARLQHARLRCVAEGLSRLRFRQAW